MTVKNALKRAAGSLILGISIMFVPGCDGKSPVSSTPVVTHETYVDNAPPSPSPAPTPSPTPSPVSQ